MLREQFKKKVENLSQEANILDGPATFVPASTLKGLMEQAQHVGLNSYPGNNPDILSLKHTVLFGIKGIAAYTDHAHILGVEDDEVYDFVFKDLEALLKQTQGTGINVYTHGEMISTHGYPEFQRFPHFYGQYGTAWQKQTREFAEFPGAILMTTNCLQRPQKSCQDNLFTSGLVGWPDIPFWACQRILQSR